MQIDILGKHSDQGFTATEVGDDIIKVYFKGTHIANFTQNTKAKVIQDFCKACWDGLQAANMRRHHR